MKLFPTWLILRDVKYWISWLMNKLINSLKFSKHLGGMLGIMDKIYAPPFQMLFFLWIRRVNLWCMTTTVEVSWSQAWTGKLLFSCQSGLSWVNKKNETIYFLHLLYLYLFLLALFLGKKIKILGGIKFKKCFIESSFVLVYRYRELC